ncbi:hypothetical protein [Pseudomonas viridiflava]|nr:hypothetical protein [Pseudomonas viridiflava]
MMKINVVTKTVEIDASLCKQSNPIFELQADMSARLLPGEHERDAAV